MYTRYDTAFLECEMMEGQVPPVAYKTWLSLSSNRPCWVEKNDMSGRQPRRFRLEETYDDMPSMDGARLHKVNKHVKC